MARWSARRFWCRWKKPPTRCSAAAAPASPSSSMAPSSSSLPASSRVGWRPFGTHLGARWPRGGRAVLLEAHDLAMVFGGFRAVDGASLSIEEGEIIGLIGPNGAGKSTFFNCLSGDLLATEGRISFAGTNVTRATPEAHARLGMARTFQVPVTFEDTCDA